MVSKKKGDRLPAGWKLQVRITNFRKVKCYINSKTHKKFYSKLAMLRYIKGSSVVNNRSSRKKGRAKKSSGKKQLHAVEVNDSHEWLPSGWLIESRIRKSGVRKGMKYKCYIDPATGSKFFSKPEVDRYLESVQSDAGSSQHGKQGSSRHSSNNISLNLPSPLKSFVESNVSELSKTHVQKSHRKVVVVRTIDGELPPGWIKEIRNKMIGNRVVRSDPLYLDPAAGLVFRSKPDALRYIKTGEVSRHAYRRKNKSLDGEGFAFVKTSPPSSDEREKATNITTRKQLFANEVSPRQCISPLPEGSSIKETGSKRITRSSLRVGLASVHDVSLEQSTLLRQASFAQITIPEKSLHEKVAATEVTEAITKDIDGKKDIKETGIKRSTRSSSRDGLASVHEASHKQSALLEQASFAQKMVPEKSLPHKVAATEVTEGITKDIDGKKDDATQRESEPSSVPPRDMLIEEKPETSPVKGFSDEKAQTSKRTMKARKTPNLPSRSSKRLAGADAEVVFHAIPIEHARRASNKKSRKTLVNSSLGSIPSESQEKPQTFDVISQNGLASQEGKLWPLNSNTQTVLETQEDSLNKIDDLTQRNALEPEIDLLEYPPGFSQNPNTEALQIKADQSLVDPTNTLAGGKSQLAEPPETLPESKIEKSSGVDLILVEQRDTCPRSRIEKSTGGDCPNQVEQPAMAERDTEQPESQFCFPSPLWSDPCLEFAYKTLTGAIPLDDNLAIEDYIQHQLRTSSKQSNINRSLPGMDMPSFCQSDETKPVSPLPEDFGIPNSNGFASQRSSR